MGIVTSKGQATIPKHIRDLLNIKPGETTVEFVVDGDRVELINTQNVNPFAKARGITKGKHTTDQIMAMTRD